MPKKGQAGIEQLSTYGWAIVIAMVVGLLLWNTGLLSPASSPGTGFSGFAGLRPLEWLCSEETGTATIVLANTAGGNLQNVSVNNVPCVPATVMPGDSATCMISGEPCCAGIPAGSRFECSLGIIYNGVTGLQKTSYGRIWGPVE